MSAADFRKLADLFPNETVTHSYVQDIDLPAVDGKSPGTFALVTLDNGLDHSKPTTLGPNTLVELGAVLEALKERAARGEIAGVGVTGKPLFPGSRGRPVHGQVGQRTRAGPVDGPAGT